MKFSLTFLLFLFKKSQNSMIKLSKNYVRESVSQIPYSRSLFLLFFPQQQSLTRWFFQFVDVFTAILSAIQFYWLLMLLVEFSINKDLFFISSKCVLFITRFFTLNFISHRKFELKVNFFAFIKKIIWLFRKKWFFNQFFVFW